ncbi:MAG: hypothetical protein ABEJ36_02245 [Candidatus Nanosalina sp.]
MDEVRVKKGFCRFSEDQLMLEETVSGYVSNMLDMWRDGGNRERAVFTLIVAVLGFSFSAVFTFIMTSSPIQLMTFSVLLIAALLSAWIHKKYHGFTSDKFIPLEEIDSVRYVEGNKWLTCPRFVINYADGGEERKRYVVMPTHFLPGVREDVEEMKRQFEDRDIEVAED